MTFTVLHIVFNKVATSYMTSTRSIVIERVCRKIRGPFTVISTKAFHEEGFTSYNMVTFWLPRIPFQKTDSRK